MKKTILIIASVMLLGVAGTAFAQDAEDEGAKKETVYDFDADTVEGALLRPEGDLMAGQRHGKDSNLIDIRADFISEMVRSVNEL